MAFSGIVPTENFVWPTVTPAQFGALLGTE